MWSIKHLHLLEGVSHCWIEPKTPLTAAEWCAHGGAAEGEASALFTAQPRKRKKRERWQTVTTEAQPWNLRWARKEPEGALCWCASEGGRSEARCCSLTRASMQGQGHMGLHFLPSASCRWPVHIHTCSTQLNIGLRLNGDRHTSVSECDMPCTCCHFFMHNFN